MSAAAALVAALLLTSGVVVALALATTTRRVLGRARVRRVRSLADPVRPLLVVLAAGEADEAADAAAQLRALAPAVWSAVEPSVLALLGKVRGDGQDEVVRLLTARGVLARTRAELRHGVLPTSAVRRARAAELLGAAQDASAVRPLVLLLTHRDREVRLVAARALGRIGDPLATRPLLECLEATPPRVPAHVVAQALLRIGMPAAATVTAALGSRSAVARFVAAEVLGRLGATTAGPALERRLLRDGSSEVRQRAATALGRIGLPGAYAALRAATGASVPVPVRAAATRALGELGDPSGIRALWSLLGDPEERVAAQAGPALVQLGPAGHRVLREVAAQDGTGRSLAVQRARDALSVAELLGQVPASEPARPELVAASAGAEGDR